MLKQLFLFSTAQAVFVFLVMYYMMEKIVPILTATGGLAFVSSTSLRLQASCYFIEYRRFF
jgi:hypothetical protein